MRRQELGSHYKGAELVLVSECYANKCLADELSQTLRRRAGHGVRPKHNYHNYRYGRDRIISEILKKQLTGKLIAVIDYERGISRHYVDKHFELREVVSCIFVGIGKRKPNIIAIVFDPDIENAFLCRISRELCRDKFQLERIKSRDACNIVKRLIEESIEGKKILNRLSEEILKILNRSLIQE